MTELVSFFILNVELNAIDMYISTAFVRSVQNAHVIAAKLNSGIAIAQLYLRFEQKHAVLCPETASSYPSRHAGSSPIRDFGRTRWLTVTKNVFAVIKRDHVFVPRRQFATMHRALLCCGSLQMGTVESEPFSSGKQEEVFFLGRGRKPPQFV